jgi:uncharacterized protein YjgD (DUF1641 family)
MKEPVEPHMSEQSSLVQAIEICIADTAIAELLAELLKARGISAFLSTPTNLQLRGKLITEIQYYKTFKEKVCPEHCLVIENARSSPPISAHTLVRPLTEEKIDKALKALIEGNSPSSSK